MVYLLWLAWMGGLTQAATGQNVPVGDDAHAARVIVCGVDHPFTWSAPFRPEFFWPVVAKTMRYFDHDIIPISGRDFPDLVENIEQRLNAERFRGIRRIEFWTHGGPGWFKIQSRALGREFFASNDKRVQEALRTLRAALLPDAVLHFRSCSTFFGPRGRAFAQASSEFFNQGGKRITVIGHTRPTGLTHPGQKTLAPGDRATWDDWDGAIETRLRGVQILLRDLLSLASARITEGAVTLVERIAARPFVGKPVAKDGRKAPARIRASKSGKR
ncbi:MAG: hypothetical protein HZB38_18650 [Planctomycetes bacterium]|nr:hypothetical protein [Planctomycetota bacterium]